MSIRAGLAALLITAATALAAPAHATAEVVYVCEWRQVTVRDGYGNVALVWWQNCGYVWVP